MIITINHGLTSLFPNRTRTDANENEWIKKKIESQKEDKKKKTDRK